MTSLEYIKTLVFPAAFGLLPRMDSPEARAMLVAIGLQESRLTHRRQLGGGPARGFWQFEFGGGVRGVLNHIATRPLIQDVLETMQYDFLPDSSYEAIQHNDVLACCFARLLLWTVPQSLPRKGDANGAWNQYISAWRPGRPHRQTWDAFYDQAWESAGYSLRITGDRSAIIGEP